MKTIKLSGYKSKSEFFKETKGVEYHEVVNCYDLDRVGGLKMEKIPYRE